MFDIQKIPLAWLSHLPAEQLLPPHTMVISAEQKEKWSAENTKVHTIPLYR